MQMFLIELHVRLLKYLSSLNPDLRRLSRIRHRADLLQEHQSVGVHPMLDDLATGNPIDDRHRHRHRLSGGWDSHGWRLLSSPRISKDRSENVQ